MKLDNYKVSELRIIAKYLELEDFEKMKKEELKALIFLKQVSDTMENNMIREHYQQVKYPDYPVGEIGATAEYPSIYDLGLNKINTHQL
jgi:hypothetical protein